MVRFRIWLLLLVIGAMAALAIFAAQPVPAPVPVARQTPLPTSVPPTSLPPLQPRATTVALRPTPPPEPPTLAPQPTPIPARFFYAQRLNYEPNFYVPQIQGLLDTNEGRLRDLRLAIGDRQHSFAEVIVGQTSYYGVNPRIILTLLEVHGRLISNPTPTGDQLAWAVGYQGENGNRRGLLVQIRWAVKQLYFARRDYPAYAPLTYADGSEAPPPPGLNLAEYALARVLAPTTLPGRLEARMQAFVETYQRLFDDPRRPPTDWPPPADPFLSYPFARITPVSSFFDHDAPFLTRDPQGSVLTYWGRAETNPAFAYDGHDGWDYAAAPPTEILAAAPGEVVFAGNADDGCATRAIVIDHGNGYRTLYWHLHRIYVATGDRVERSEPIGMVGNSGCSTGPHLHMGVQYLGRSTDPYGWCGATPDPWAQHPAGNASRWLWRESPSPCGPPPPGAVLVDAGSPGFFTNGGAWSEAPAGAGGSTLFTPAQRRSDPDQPWRMRFNELPALVVWQPQLPRAGQYRVLAYQPYTLSGLNDSRRLRYRIQHADGETDVFVNSIELANEWADLGTYRFDPTLPALVTLSGSAETANLTVWGDAMIWLPVSP